MQGTNSDTCPCAESARTPTILLILHTGAIACQGTASAQPIQSDDEDDSKEPNCLLQEPDFHLMQALMESQQNFTISDPSVPDNPIVYASQVCKSLSDCNVLPPIYLVCDLRQAWRHYIDFELLGYYIYHGVHAHRCTPVGIGTCCPVPEINHQY